MIHKRPAGLIHRQPTWSQEQLAVMIGKPPVEPWTADVVGGVAHPPWPQTYIGTVRQLLMGLWSQVPNKHLVLNVWCDCGGMGTEALALKDIAAEVANLGLNFDVSVYMFCDQLEAAQTFARRNLKPKHMADDIKSRDFDLGTFECKLCDASHIMPTSGIDLYVCCFPCSPWSCRGTRLGFKHNDGNLIFYSIQTIKHVKPVLIYMENVIQVGSSSSDCDGDMPEADLGVMIKAMKSELPEYEFQLIKPLTPGHAGYPTLKPRLGVVGGRTDVLHHGALEYSFGQLINEPVPICADWRMLLGRPTITVDWAKLGNLPSARDVDQLISINDGCTCHFDPSIVCSTHPCKCQACKKGGTCIWRSKHTDFIKKNFVSQDVPYADLLFYMGTKLMYLQVMALHVNHEILITSPRERNMLNILALLPCVAPGINPLTIVDKSQSIDRSSMRVDGRVGTMATNADMWCLADGDALTLGEMAKLMGHDITALDLEGITKVQFRSLLGMSVHRGVAGFLCTGLLAALGFN